jgi:Zn-finger nucleic acid-binding protein
MPLLVSPIDNTTPMQQIYRNGIEIDRCPVSGGIWLDRGELEKLLEVLNSAAAADREEYAEYRKLVSHIPKSSTGQRPSYKHDDDYDDYYKRKYGKKNKLKSIFDIFD